MLAVHAYRYPNTSVVSSPVHPIQPKKPMVLKEVNVVRFCRSAVENADNIIFLSVEPKGWGAKQGGLGMVTEDIPAAMIKHMGKDVRVVTPFVRGMTDDGSLKRTGLSIKLKGFDGVEDVFELYEGHFTTSDAVNIPIYAIRNDKYFCQHNNLYIPMNRVLPPLGEDAIVKAVAMFNRAAARLVPFLNEDASLPPGVKLAQFKGRAKAIILNDWLNGAFTNEADPNYLRDTGKVAIIHNTFNETRDAKTAKLLGLSPMPITPPAHNVVGYDPLYSLVSGADVVIGDANYLRRIASTLHPNAPFAKALSDKITAGDYATVHHGVSSVFNPFDNKYLSTKHFTKLRDVDSPEEIGRFKAVNKKALQETVMDGDYKSGKTTTPRGLAVDPEAIIFTWLARMDSYQKGFNLLVDQAARFLDRHPKAQLVIAGKPGGFDPAIQAFKVFMYQKFPGRIVFTGHVDEPDIVRINAGSDFMILPSIYEPFGLSQLESMVMGAVPIVQAVDGLKTTVLEGSHEPQHFPRGIAMNELNPHLQWEIINKRQAIEAKTFKVTHYIDQLNQAKQQFAALKQAGKYDDAISLIIKFMTVVDAAIVKDLKKSIEAIQSTNRSAEEKAERIERTIHQHMSRKKTQLMAESDTWANQFRLGNHLPNKALSPEQVRELSNSRMRFADALDRAYTLAVTTPKELKKYQANGIRYVRDCHNWKAMIQSYEAPLKLAMQKVVERQNRDSSAGGQLSLTA